MNENICDNNINDIFNDIFKENRTQIRKIKSKDKNIANIYMN